MEQGHALFHGFDVRGITQHQSPQTALGLGQLSAEATSLVAVIPTVLVGAYRQHGYGNVRVKTACILGVSSVAGVYVGILVALAADESHLRKLFGVLLIAAAAQLAWRSAKTPRRS